MHNNGYWRNGPIGNNAVSGVDMALWDIKGREANMPVYHAYRGQMQERASRSMPYANGESREEILDEAQKRLEEGYHNIRLQYFPMKGFSQNQRPWRPVGAKEGFYQDPKAYVEETVAMFDEARSRFGYAPELVHDVHERVPAATRSFWQRLWSHTDCSFLRISLPRISTSITKT